MRGGLAAFLLCLSLAAGGCGSSGAPATPPAAYWIGDSYTAGTGASSTATGEAYEVSAALGWHPYLDAEGGTGFVVNRHERPAYEPLPKRLAPDKQAVANPDVVVIDAGRNDSAVPPARIGPVVRAYFAALAKTYPAAAVVVIAPFEMRSPRHAYAGLRHLLGTEARARGWAFVDPIAEGWVNSTSAKLVSDGIHPNQAGYDYIAAHLAPAIKQALARAHETVK